MNGASVEVRSLSKAFGSTPVLREVSLGIEPGSVLALLGPSGCGKTTLLRSIAGLEVPDAGEVQVGGRVLTSPEALVPPERRRIGMVFQDWALFPHLSVGANVGYGLPRGERSAERVEAALAMVGLEGLGDRSPGTLSGGQQQRVALARALAPRPSVLLLDEPFSNLDTALRVEVRTEVHRLLVELGITTVFVTHDQEEAFVLGDEVAVMRHGVIEQRSAPAALYAAPASPWVAGFVGDANLVRGHAHGDHARTPVGAVPLAARSDGAVQVLVRPEALALGPGDDAVVELVEFYGHDSVYEVVLDAGLRLRARVPASLVLVRGQRVGVRYAGSATSAWALDEEGDVTPPASAPVALPVDS
ncbi:MAG: ABC transporter ATP-binding protein [Actinobacteria bacterium]|nr:ABC transporter ATP-binding protein [Actinomycetota bacterium]MBW3641625.1 ABC transporter ATP-binding protein [Actinomycetota bacterium]